MTEEKSISVGYTEESPGVKSANRLIFIIGMGWLMLITSVLAITKAASITECTLFFTTISAILYSGKLIQKNQENKQ